MKKLNFLILAIASLLLISADKCSDGNNYGYEEFPKLLKRAKLLFYLPDDYGMLPIIKNNQCSYDLAFKIDDVEVRYQIVPYDKELKEYNEYKNNYDEYLKKRSEEAGKEIKEIVKVDPNGMYQAYFQSVLFNISKKEKDKIGVLKNSIEDFPPEGVKNEFNADYGVSAWGVLDPEFGQNYKFYSIYMIHKKDCGMALVFRLFNEMPDYEYIKEFNEKCFYNIRFE